MASGPVRPWRPREPRPNWDLWRRYATAFGCLPRHEAPPRDRGTAREKMRAAAHLALRRLPKTPTLADRSTGCDPRFVLYRNFRRPGQVPGSRPSGTVSGRCRFRVRVRPRDIYYRNG